MLTREESRRADENAIRNFRIPSLVLMENAGRTCAELLMWHSHQGPRSQQAVLVLCGPGNNGGDGFVIARHLYIEGVDVKVVLFRRAENYVGDAKLNLDALSRLRMPVVEFDADWNDEKVQQVFSKIRRNKETTWVVDALLGTGASGEPRGSIAKAIRVANRLNVRRFAVDISSGLDCDSGLAANPTFRADLTGTMIDRKAAFENSSSEEFTGQVLIVGIGAPNEIRDNGSPKTRGQRSK